MMDLCRDVRGQFDEVANIWDFISLKNCGEWVVFAERDNAGVTGRNIPQKKKQS